MEHTEATLGGAQSVDRALALLSLVARHSDEGIALSAIVRESGLNKATARRLLLALMRAGLIGQAADRRSYFLGEEAYFLGQMAQSRHGLLTHAMDSLQRLARETGDAAFVSVRRGLYGFCLHREDGAYPIRTYALMPGAHHPLGVGAGTLAMLAALPDIEAEAVIDGNRAEMERSYPLLTPERLRALCAQTRETGVALNPGLVFEDSWGLGVALHGPDGWLVGAVSLAAVQSRMRKPRRDELARQLQAEARMIEKRLAGGAAQGRTGEGQTR